MPVDEETRLDVYEGLKEVHGAKRAGPMMEMMLPAGASELATKGDLEVLRLATKGDLEALRLATKRDLEAEIKVLRAEMAALEARLGERIEAVRADLHEAMENQTTRYVRWMLAGMAIMTGAFGTVVTVAIALVV